jgi:diadenosine tetraphosphate (Ap4A) HIT family hydrolase
MEPCKGCDKAADAAADPSLVAELGHSWLLLGDHQAFPGYCVLWSKAHAKELHHLGAAAYAGFMDDLRRASAAVEAATGCWKLNVVSLGNVVQHAHVHLMPRSAFDPDRQRHPWAHESEFNEPGTAEQRNAMIERVREALKGAA